MNWKEEAKKELRNYKQLKESISITEDRIALLEAQKTSVRSPTSGSVPVQGGAGNGHEDRLLDLIAKTEREKLTLDANRIRVGLIERGLAVMTEQERKILLTFADHRSGEAVDLLSAELFLERAQIYRLWDAALQRFTIAEYGIIEW